MNLREDLAPRCPGAGAPMVMSPEAVRHARFVKQMAWRFEEAGRLFELPAEGRRLYADIVSLRSRLATEGGVPAYRILTNRQVLRIAEVGAKVAAIDDAVLARDLGMNPTKIAAFGSEIAALHGLHFGCASTQLS